MNRASTLLAFLLLIGAFFAGQTLAIILVGCAICLLLDRISQQLSELQAGRETAE